MLLGDDTRERLSKLTDAGLLADAEVFRIMSADDEVLNFQDAAVKLLPVDPCARSASSPRQFLFGIAGGLIARSATVDSRRGKLASGRAGV